MNPPWTGLAKFSSVFLRLALGISFLSAVAGRFDLWGVYGQANASWGNLTMTMALGVKAPLNLSVFFRCRGSAAPRALLF